MLVVGLIAGRFVFLRAPDVPSTPVSPLAIGNGVQSAVLALSANPNDPVLLTRLGLAQLAEARRTADPSWFAKAAASIERARQIAPDELTTLVAAGLVALARHDFAGALALSERARTLAPLAVDPLGVRTDALVELGRYDEASETALEMVSRRPDLASYSRASYVAELRGDRAGARDLMQQAAAAGGVNGPDVAYVLALLGDLDLATGHLDAAAAVYARAEAASPGQPQAALGRARVAIDRGDLADAANRLRALTERLPLPDAVALYADVLAASGDSDGAEEQRQVVRAIEALSQSQGGIAVDLELARFEAAHARDPGGDPGRAVQLAVKAHSVRPTIYSEDVWAWALRGDGDSKEALTHAQAAVRLGTQDASLWWHLAAIEADLGQLDAARAHLAKAFSFSPYLPIAERAEAAELAARLDIPLR